MSAPADTRAADWAAELADARSLIRAHASRTVVADRIGDGAASDYHARELVYWAAYAVAREGWLSGRRSLSRVAV